MYENGYYQYNGPTGAEEEIVFNVTIKKHTSKAILIRHDGREFWLPKSQISILSSGFFGFGAKISVPEWLLYDRM